jgi:hypothetical protein
VNNQVVFWAPDLLLLLCGRAESFPDLPTRHCLVAEGRAILAFQQCVLLSRIFIPPPTVLTGWPQLHSNHSPIRDSPELATGAVLSTILTNLWTVQYDSTPVVLINTVLSTLRTVRFAIALH